MAIEGFALDALPDPNRDVPSDASLMRQLIEGSQDALAGLYDRHAEAVFAAALRVSRDRGIAAEVVQDTFLTLWNRAELFDPSRGNLPAWLLAIARNRAIDRLRAAGRHERAATFSSFGRGEADDQSTAEWLTSTGDLIGAAGPEPGPEMALADKETRESIQDALSSLSPLERRVIELAYATGLSQSEIAAQLGLADGDGQDQDETGPPAPPRAPRGAANGCWRLASGRQPGEFCRDHIHVHQPMLTAWMSVRA